MCSKSLELCPTLCNSWTVAYQCPLSRGFTRQDCFCCESRSVMSDSLRLHGLHSLWNSPGQNAGADSHSLPQWIFPTQERTQVSRTAGGFFTPRSHQGRPRQDYLSGLPCPSQRDLPNPGMEPSPYGTLFCLLHWQEGFLKLVPLGSPAYAYQNRIYIDFTSINLGSHLVPIWEPYSAGLNSAVFLDDRMKRISLVAHVIKNLPAV